MCPTHHKSPKRTRRTPTSSSNCFHPMPHPLLFTFIPTSYCYQESASGAHSLLQLARTEWGTAASPMACRCSALARSTNFESSCTTWKPHGRQGHGPSEWFFVNHGNSRVSVQQLLEIKVTSERKREGRGRAWTCWWWERRTMYTHHRTIWTGASSEGGRGGRSSLDGYSAYIRLIWYLSYLFYSIVTIIIVIISASPYEPI